MTERPEFDLSAIRALCRRYRVSRLDVFGSAVTAGFDPEFSDVDFLVEFEPGTVSLETYFGFKEALELLLDRAVELVSPNALDNPYFAATVAESRQELYAA